MVFCCNAVEKRFFSRGGLCRRCGMRSGMKRVVISGVGAVVPETSISNDQLVATFNEWVDLENIARGKRGEELLGHSSSEFIEKASGIKNRRVLFPDGVLDVERMAGRV